MILSVSCCKEVGSREIRIMSLQKYRKELMISSIWKIQERFQVKVTLKWSFEEHEKIVQMDRRKGVQGRAY